MFKTPENERGDVNVRNMNILGSMHVTHFRKKLL
jgi:hypothetical protein